MRSPMLFRKLKMTYIASEMSVLHQIKILFEALVQMSFNMVSSHWLVAEPALSLFIPLSHNLPQNENTKKIWNYDVKIILSDLKLYCAELSFQMISMM